MFWQLWLLTFLELRSPLTLVANCTGDGYPVTRPKEGLGHLYTSHVRSYHYTRFRQTAANLVISTCHTLHTGSCHIASCHSYHTISVQSCGIYTFKDRLWAMVWELAREPLSLSSPQDIPQDMTASWNLLDAHKPRPE